MTITMVLAAIGLFIGLGFLAVAFVIGAWLIRSWRKGVRYRDGIDQDERAIMDEAFKEVLEEDLDNEALDKSIEAVNKILKKLMARKSKAAS